MKADPTDQQRLLELQDLDSRLGRLARREAELPERAALAVLDADRVRVRADLASLRGTLEDAQAELRRVESDVDSVTSRAAKEQERMLAATEAKQAAALDRELESLRRRQSDLEDLELVIMERVEEHQAAVNGVAAELEEVEQRRADAEHAVGAALQDIATERERAQAARASLQDGLPAELVALYERQRGRYGFGATLLRRGVSEASGVALLADELANVRAAAPDDVLICPSSNAILVRTAESGL